MTHVERVSTPSIVIKKPVVAAPARVDQAQPVTADTKTPGGYAPRVDNADPRYKAPCIFCAI